MTRTGEEVKAKYKKQWTRAPARVSLYKTPCPPDLPPFRGCWRQPAAAAVFTPAVCRAMCGFAGIAPTLSPRRQLCAAPRYEGRFDQGERAGSSTSGRRDGFLRFPLAESHTAGLRGAIVRGSRQPTFAHQHSERTALPTQPSGCRRSDTLAEDEQSDVPQVGEHRFVEGISSQRVRRAHIVFTKERACCHRRQRHRHPKWG